MLYAEGQVVEAHWYYDAVAKCWRFVKSYVFHAARTPVEIARVTQVLTALGSACVAVSGGPCQPVRIRRPKRQPQRLAIIVGRRFRPVVLVAVFNGSVKWTGWSWL